MAAAAQAALGPSAAPRQSLAWYRVFGPGAIFALTVIGPGDLVSNVTAGATHGYQLLWALALTMVFRYAWLEASARYVMTTGETLIEGYGRLGRWIVWVVLASLVAARHLSNLYKVVLMGAAANLLAPLPTPYSAAIWSIVFTLTAFALMFWGHYTVIERWFRALIACLGAGLIVAAALSHPNLRGVAHGLFVPVIPGVNGLYSSILLLTALIGTEAGSLTNVTYSYFIQRKGWRDLSWQRQQRTDLLASVICIFLAGALLQIAAAGTLHSASLVPQDAKDLVRVFSQTLGGTGRIIFIFGLWAVAFSGFVGCTTGYALVASDICHKFAPRLARATRAGDPELRRDRFYRGAVAFWALSPLYVVFTRFKPVSLVLGVSAAVVMLIPLLGLALLRLTNDSKRMGIQRNGWLSNAVILLLVAIAVYFSYRNGVEVWHGWLHS